MARKTAAQKSNLSELNIVPNCKIQIVNEKTWKTETIAMTLYTPLAINKVLKKHKLQSAFVLFLGSRELWRQGTGRLAEHVNPKRGK